MGRHGGAPTAAGWGEDCWTGPPILVSEAAIADFLKRVQERRGYMALDAVLSRLQVPRKVDRTGVSVTVPMKAGMLPRMEDEEERRPPPPTPLKCFCDP